MQSSTSGHGGILSATGIIPERDFEQPVEVRAKLVAAWKAMPADEKERLLNRHIVENSTMDTLGNAEGAIEEVLAEAEQLESVVEARAKLTRLRDQLLGAQDRQGCATSSILKFCNGRESRLLAQAFDIGSGKTVGTTGEILEIDVGGEWHALAAQAHDRCAIGYVGFGKRQDVVEASAAQKRGIDTFWPVCGCEQNHTLLISVTSAPGPSCAETTLC